MKSLHLNFHSDSYGNLNYITLTEVCFPFIPDTKVQSFATLKVTENLNFIFKYIASMHSGMNRQTSPLICE